MDNATIKVQHPLHPTMWTITGQSLADFLTTHPIPTDSPLCQNLLDEHVMEVTLKDPCEWKTLEKKSPALA